MARSCCASAHSAAHGGTIGSGGAKLVSQVLRVGWEACHDSSGGSSPLNACTPKGAGRPDEGGSSWCRNCRGSVGGQVQNNLPTSELPNRSLVTASVAKWAFAFIKRAHTRVGHGRGLTWCGQVGEDAGSPHLSPTEGADGSSCGVDRWVRVPGHCISAQRKGQTGARVVWTGG
eukprot:361120-Chlamydomonas_euryale.AAC.2